MKSFFEKKSYKDPNKKFLKDRNAVIKESLIYNLTENVKEVEYEFQEKHEKLTICDSTGNLTSTVEAIFLHGLKDTFLELTFAFMGNDVDQSKPNPNFFPIISIFLHKNIIEEIQSFSQLKTEVGYGRAFVRSALNDSLLSSYFANIRKNQSLLKNFYNKYAFLYDSELMEMAEKVISGFESFVIFDLPCNSSLLNEWPNAPLQLSGVWTPALRSCPVAHGVDIASSLCDEPTTSKQIAIPKNTANIDDIYSNSITNSIFSNSPKAWMDDDDRLNKLLREFDEVSPDADEMSMTVEVPEKSSPKEKTPDKEILQESPPKSLAEQEPIKTLSPKTKIIDSSPQETLKFSTGNSLSAMNRSWSMEEQDEKEEAKEKFEELVSMRRDNIKESVSMDDTKIVHSRQNSRSMSTISVTFAPDRVSYNTLLRKCSNVDYEASFREVWSRFERTLSLSISRKSMSVEKGEDDSDYEVVGQIETTKMTELQEMVQMLCQLGLEKGLDSQGFMCKYCNTALGIDFCKAQICAFSGHYLCNSCLSPDRYQIPAKIVYNWDFTNYSVSLKAAEFLSEYQFVPLIDFKLLNPNIYKNIDCMARLQSLRIQLNFIRAYIFTCNENIILELQKKLFSKEYLFEHIHQYSISDLSLISTGSLEELLKKIVTFGKDHIHKCALCSQKGFICELCRKPKVIYPFEVDDTYQCNLCGAVFHVICSGACPKCERRRKRESDSMRSISNDFEE